MESLILEDNVDAFLFGSRSNFDELCHMVVTELKEKYPNIRRIAYFCKHETACLVGEGEETRRSIKNVTGRDVCGRIRRNKKSDRVNSAGCTVYIERNQWMIDDSDFIIIYLDENKNQIFSGTNVVYE